MNIVADVLRAAKNNGKKTRIMYFANLSHSLLERYLREMVNVGLMNFAGNGYEVTKKGESFLDRYHDFLSRYNKADGKLKVLMSEKRELEEMSSEGNEGGN